MPGIAEFDLAGLDSPSLAPAGISPHELDLPQPVEPPSDLDLPAPAVPAAAAPPLDLPTPVGSPAAAPPLDLPTPVNLDLPTPVIPGPPVHPPAAAAPAAPPVYPGAPSLDGSGVDLPAPVDLDLPTPVDLDLPTPVRSDELRPAGMEVTPAGMDLEPSGMGLEPSAMDLEPATTGLQPAVVDGLEPAHTGLRPADLDLEPSAGQGLAPVGPKGAAAAGATPAAAAAAAAAAVGTDQAVPAPTRTPSPANKINPVRAPSRGLMIAAGGLLVVGLAGAGVLYSGILDPIEDPQPASLSGKGGKGGKPAAAAGGAAVERSAEVGAKLAADTPAAYREAMTLAEQAGDIVGVAEAAFLLHYRYGPDVETVTKAASGLQPYAEQKDAFVQRVFGLASLAAKQLQKAEGSLAGDDVQSKLYRGWLRMAQHRPADALTEALAVLASNTDNRGALCLKLAALAKTDPSKAAVDAQAAIDAYGTHPGVQVAYVAIMLDAGNIAKARTVTGGMSLPEGAPPAFEARIKTVQADVAAASGHYRKAAKLYQEGLALVAGDVEIATKRVRALVKAGKFPDAEALIVDTARAHPDAAQMHLVKAEVAIAGGETDRAVKALANAQKALPEDPRVPHLAGQVHAMKLEVEDAQKMFAASRERDASFIAASIDEARLLAKLKKLPDALKLLDDAKKAADDEGRKRDGAELLAAKAELQLGANKRVDGLASLTAALELAPGHNESQLQRGLTRIAAGQHADGEADLEAVFERTGGFPGLARVLGMIYLRDGRIDDLEKLIGDDLDGDNTPPDLMMLGARLRLLQGKPADAKVFVEAGLALNPNDWEGHMLLSEVYLREGKPADALTAVEKSRPLEPQAELYLQRGRVLEFNSNHDEARPLYYKAAELDPTMHEARWLYGRSLETSGNYAAAIDQLSKVVAVESAKTAPWFPEAWQYLGLAQSKADQRTEAIKSLKQAVSLNESLGEAHAELGKLYEQDNKHAPAIAALTKATKVAKVDDHWYVDALMNLGRAQQKSGKTAQAKATFKKYLDIAPADASGRAEARRIVGI